VNGRQSINQQIALMRYNARRCEQARSRICNCRCGGLHHGKAHPGPWLDEQAQLIRESEQQEQLPMVGT
jgi:hypothetical protein